MSLTVYLTGLWMNIHLSPINKRNNYDFHTEAHVKIATNKPIFLACFLDTGDGEIYRIHGYADYEMRNCDINDE